MTGYAHGVCVDSVQCTHTGPMWPMEAWGRVHTQRAECDQTAHQRWTPGGAVELFLEPHNKVLEVQLPTSCLHSPHLGTSGKTPPSPLRLMTRFLTPPRPPRCRCHHFRTRCSQHPPHRHHPAIDQSSALGVARGGRNTAIHFLTPSGPCRGHGTSASAMAMATSLRGDSVRSRKSLGTSGSQRGRGCQTASPAGGPLHGPTDGRMPVAPLLGLKPALGLLARRLPDAVE